MTSRNLNRRAPDRVLRLAVLLVGVTAGQAAPADNYQFYRWIIDFPEGEQDIVRRKTLTVENYEYDSDASFNITVNGPAPFLVEAEVGGPSCRPDMAFTYYWAGETILRDTDVSSPTFRRFWPINTDVDQRENIKLEVGLASGEPVVSETLGTRDLTPNVPDGWACEFVFRVSRDTGCTMWAEVTGDVRRTASSGIAYFNTFANGVPITTGTIADESMHEQLDDFAGMMEGMAALAEELGYEVPEMTGTGEGETAPSARGSMQAMRDELFAEGGDRFGLTLTDLNTEAMDEDVGNAGLNQMLRDSGVLTGSFTLEASAPGGVEVLEHPDQSIDLDSGAGSVITVPLSSLRVVPGGLDGDFNRVPFVYDESQGGSAILTINGYSDDYIYGQVGGELVTENEYDGRRLNINVAATFSARRGFKSCMR